MINETINSSILYRFYMICLTITISITNTIEKFLYNDKSFLFIFSFITSIVSVYDNEFIDCIKWLSKYKLAMQHIVLIKKCCLMQQIENTNPFYMLGFLGIWLIRKCSKSRTYFQHLLMQLWNCNIKFISLFI